MNEQMKDQIEDVRSRIRELDAIIAKLYNSLATSEFVDYADARDHLKQIHFRLTECKGHLGSVKYDLGLKNE